MKLLTDPAVETRRFGLGASPGSMLASGDPRERVLAQLQPDAARLDHPDLKPWPEISREIWDFQEEEKRQREAKPAPLPAGAQGMQPAMGGGMMGGPAPQMGMDAGMMAAPKPGAVAAPVIAPPRLYFERDVMARLERQITTQTPLVERLVNFWSNHFCVSAEKNQHLRAGAGAYEREAIRPHVLGRFGDMVTAVAHHPGMLMYLDNTGSVGPTSKAGIREKKGLNENLGREIMELHTLGVDGGYSQADVTAFARALTGWSIAYRQDKQVEPGRFRFYPDRHEPGIVTIMGREYRQENEAQAQAALDAFSVHPATARHIARKLAVHFHSDDPPKAMVERLEATFVKTGGDLLAVTRALVTSDEAWSAPQSKVLSPWDLVVALGRGLGITWTFGEANRILLLFGQPTWEVPFPTGWPDADETWASPDSLLELLDAVAALARKHAGKRDIPELAAALLGPVLRPDTLSAIQRCETRDQGLALLIMSPEFLRR